MRGGVTYEVYLRRMEELLFGVLTSRGIYRVGKIDTFSKKFLKISIDVGFTCPSAILRMERGGGEKALPGDSVPSRTWVTSILPQSGKQVDDRKKKKKIQGRRKVEKMK